MLCRGFSVQIQFFDSFSECVCVCVVIKLQLIQWTAHEPTQLTRNQILSSPSLLFLSFQIDFALSIYRYEMVIFRIGGLECLVAENFRLQESAVAELNSS